MCRARDHDVVGGRVVLGEAMEQLRPAVHGIKAQVSDRLLVGLGIGSPDVSSATIATRAAPIAAASAAALPPPGTGSLLPRR